MVEESQDLFFKDKISNLKSIFSRVEKTNGTSMDTGVDDREC